MKRTLPLGAVLAALALTGCGDSTGEQNGSARTVGGQCNARLSAVVDKGYLRAHGIGIDNSQQATISLGGAIAQVCSESSPGTPVDDAGEDVVSAIEADL